MVNISVSCFKAAVCLYPNVVSGLVEVGLRRAWERLSTKCVVTSFDEIIGNARVTGKIRGVGGSLFIRLGDVGC